MCEEQLSAVNHLFVINSHHSFHTGFLPTLRDFCSCVKMASWCFGQCKTIRGGEERAEMHLKIVDDKSTVG